MDEKDFDHIMSKIAHKDHQCSRMSPTVLLFLLVPSPLSRSFSFPPPLPFTFTFVPTFLFASFQLIVVSLLNHSCITTATSPLPQRHTKNNTFCLWLPTYKL